jgi:hypothetical protein
MDSVVRGNRAEVGGGIWANETDVTLVGSVVRGNSATLFGGGISHVFGGTLSLTSSTVTGNTAGAHGGGIDVLGDGPVTLDAASAVTGNTPDECAGTPAC